MAYPISLVLIALIAAFCFIYHLHALAGRAEFDQDNAGRLRKVEEDLSLQRKAISNLAEQTIKEISTLRDKVGTVSLAVGMKPKDPK